MERRTLRIVAILGVVAIPGKNTVSGQQFNFDAYMNTAIGCGELPHAGVAVCTGARNIVIDLKVKQYLFPFSGCHTAPRQKFVVSPPLCEDVTVSGNGIFQLLQKESSYVALIYVSDDFKGCP
jgi:hypothetical protein